MFDNHSAHTRSRTHLWFCALLAVGLSGCASMHETDLEPAQKIQPEQIRLADDIRLARDEWPSERWWTAYGDPQLDALIEQALSQAPTLAVVQSKLDRARAQVEMTEAVGGFQLAAVAAIHRMHASEGGITGPLSWNIPVLGLTGPWHTAGMVGVLGGYEFDFWGKHRSQVDAAIGAENAQVAEQAAIELEISAGVAQLYYGIQATLHTLDLLEQAHDIVAENVKAHEARAARGLESKTLTEDARAQQLGLERQISTARTMTREMREGLRALVGASADDLPEIAMVPLPSAEVGLPATLSYELLARRPDLQVMRWYVQATASGIDVAKAAFYPSFDIKVFYGLTSLHLDDLFRSDNQQFDLIPGLTLPIFTSGLLNANLKAATAANNAAIAQYNQAVLNAVSDVAITGTRLEGLHEEEELQIQKLDAVTFAMKSAEAHYKQGLVSRITAMKARLPVNAEEIALLAIHREQISQSITLVKALGGGYRAEE